MWRQLSCMWHYLLGATGTSLSLNVGPSVCRSFFLSFCRLQLSRLVGWSVGRLVGCPFIKRKPIHATS